MVFASFKKIIIFGSEGVGKTTFIKFLNKGNNNIDEYGTDISKKGIF